MPVDIKYSVSSFQQMDGSNFTTFGVDCNAKFKNSNIGVYLGSGTSFTGNSLGLVTDIKGGIEYGKGVSGGFRVRNNINPKSKTVQIRIQPATVEIPINSKSKFYTTPYIATKIDHDTRKTDTKIGNFTGVSTKINDEISVFAEAQVYDIKHINKSTTSINVGASIYL